MLGGLKHGTVKKKGDKVKNWKQRYVLMQEAAFYYYEKEGDKKAKGSISVSDVLRVGPSMDAKHTLSFLVETAARTWEIEVGSTTELNEWMETFTILALLSRCSTFVEREMHAWHAPDNHAGFRADLISCACELVRLVCKLGGEVRAASPMKKRSAAPSTGAEALQSPHGKSAASGTFSESFTLLGNSTLYLAGLCLIVASKPESKQPLSVLHQQCKALTNQLENCYQLVAAKGDVAAGYAYKHIYSLLDRLAALHPHQTAELMRKSLAKVVNAIKNIGAATPTKEQTTELTDAAAEIAKTAEENAAMHKGLLSAAQEVQAVVLSIYSGDASQVNAKKDGLRTAIVALDSALALAFPQRDEVVGGLDGLGRLIEMRNGRSIAEMLMGIFPPSKAPPAAAAPPAATKP